MSDFKYANDRTFGDSFLPEVKSILGQILLTSKFEEEDRERNTDLIVLTMAAKRVGVRIRRKEFYKDPYWNQFTIRAKKASGHQSEYRKIIANFGDYFFYGFEGETPKDGLRKWIVGDLNKFRIYCNIGLAMEGRAFLDKRTQTVAINGDTFFWFWDDEIPGFIVASSAKSKITAHGWEAPIVDSPSQGDNFGGDSHVTI